MDRSETISANRFGPLVPTLFSIIIAGGLSVILRSNPAVLFRIEPFQGSGLLKDTVNALVFVGLGSLLLVIIYVLYERTGVFVRRVMMSVLIVPTIFILTVFFGQTILLAFFKNNPNLLFSFLTLFTIYLSTFSAILILTDSLPEKAKNMILLFYGSSLGVFLGFSLPTVSIIFLLLALGIEDYLIIGVLLSDKAKENFENGIHGYFGLTEKGYMLGIGDLILCPILTAHSLTRFGIELSVATIVLLLLGVVFNLFIAQRKEGRQIFPGLLVPTVLGILPLALHTLLVR
jgi:hypothetical protein